MSNLRTQIAHVSLSCISSLYHTGDHTTVTLADAVNVPFQSLQIWRFTGFTFLLFITLKNYCVKLVM